MTVPRAFFITIASSAVFAFLGAMIGSVLGTLAPGYYRAVFRIPPQADFDAVQTGLGLGLTQGLGTGVAAGLVIVALVAWYQSRVAHRPR